MTSYRLAIVGNESLKLSLIKNELSQIPELIIDIRTLGELSSMNRLLDLNLVMLDYSLVNNTSYQDLYINGLGYDVLLFSAPESCFTEDIVRWKCLRGVLPHTAPVEHLRKSVMHVLKGGMWMPRYCLEKMLNYYRSPSVYTNHLELELTRRERQILSQIANGQSNQQIAENLFLAESTVKTHIYKLYKKMNVHSRHDALMMFRRSDWYH